MKKKMLLALLMTTVTGTVTTAQSMTHRLSVKELIEYYSGQSGVPLHEQSAEAIVKMRFADGYLTGVTDSVQGKVWCDTGKVKTDEINSIVVAQLRKVPPEKQDKSAGQTALKILQNKFPCKG